MRNDNSSELDSFGRATSSAKAILLLILIVSLINYLRWRSFDPAMDKTWIYSFIGSAALGLPFFFTKKIRLSTSLAIFWLAMCIMIVAISEANIILVRRLDNFSPFGGFKLFAMAIAVGAPIPAINGYLAIAACAVAPIVLYWTVLADLHSKIPMPEPGITVVACVVAICVLIYRLKNIHIERENARLRAEKEKLDEFARIILILRDLTNTPLQVIELTNELLKSGQMDPDEAALRIETSLEKLKSISQMLSNYQLAQVSDAQLRQLYDASDSMAFLKNRLDELRE